MNKIKIYSISISMCAVLVTLLINSSHAYGESDFTLEAKVNKPNSDLNVTKFEIQGQGYKEMCPSGQCKIDYIGDKFTRFVAPRADLMYINAFNNFDLQNNVTNPDLGPKKKEFMEKFNANMLCRVDDIKEDNGQEIYTCHNGRTQIWREFDHRTWNYDTTAIFDAKKNTLNAHGNLEGK